MRVPSCAPRFPRGRGWQPFESVFWRKAEQWFCHGRAFDLLLTLALYILPGGHGEPIKLQRPRAEQVSLQPLTVVVVMIFHTAFWHPSLSPGPTKPALVLLCCMGTWLAICSQPFGVPTAKILKLLKWDLEELYKNYSEYQEPGMKTDESLQLPCFTPGCEASANISTIKAYLEEVERLNGNNISTAHIRKWLDDISCSDPPKPSISGPEDFYERKIFTLTVFKRLSDCMTKLGAENNTSGVMG
ncbi:interleukin-31 [Peromyscus leucopus]|uniref:interleukin-31 n=1 Tax=Peromyscus leucopus TaxID=10041 RepID=UPI0018859237|nr:interleukin-31 [Peromyscus leucopus]